MPERKYDLVVLGATGYTGQYVAEEVGRIAEKQSSLTYAFAGRNKEKLEHTLETAQANTGLDLAKAEILVVDVNDEESLKKMAAQAKVVINCVGPYRYYGLKVVKACVEEGANHVDISGEPQYLEQAQLEYSEAAQKAGVHVVGSCGFDSIPADLGTTFLQQVFPGDVNSVEAVVTTDDDSEGKASINFTTMECAVLGLTHSKELKGLRKKLFTTQLPKPSFRPEPRGKLFYSDEAKRWCVPNMASDRSVVMRTQRILYEKEQMRPTQFQVYFGMTRFNAILSILFGILFYILTMISFTRSLLLKYPEFFTGGVVTRQGPKRSDLTGLKFLVVLTGKGWDKKLEDPAQQHTDPPNVTKTVKVKGPDPGYFGTAILVTQSALTILEEKDKLPQEGGVFPPGAAFLKTSLRQRLEEKGIHFTADE
ncbi:saccharopine dehydrogenase-like oxidoreductase [Portunus trituberculatus]|uniref:Saccharopine dehydrogenase-like oxidoreductase n=1 Tax=Portunus trituberculatus TaxID=210409 RepID=A0A5B7CN46_PORTR|nr:saccharopine dehydrogenase-like oxidoreductase [Portunus trituberculatus]MPC10261.1 Saccharopine dehydrogenase-like oxidoreductase [Portunus trituberculatus]